MNMYNFDNEIRNPSQELPINITVTPNFEIQYVDSSTSFNEMQYRDISASNQHNNNNHVDPSMQFNNEMSYDLNVFSTIDDNTTNTTNMSFPSDRLFYELQPFAATLQNNICNPINNPSLQLNNIIYNEQDQIDSNAFDNTKINTFDATNTQYPTYYVPELTKASDELLPTLSIIKQPKKLYRFRFESEMKKESHGYLLGVDSAGRNCRTYCTVELQKPISKDEQYFIRCTLHQPFTDGIDTDYLVSPHKLCRRKSDSSIFTDEAELYPMVPYNNHYIFELERFFIMCPKQELFESKCKEKYLLLQKQKSSKLYLRKLPKKMEKKQVQVQIGFEVFKRIQNGSYDHVAGPIFSHCITNGEPLKITKICNLNGSVNGGTEVTLLVTGYKPNMNISIEIDDKRGWNESVEITKDMLHCNSAITFVTPMYDNKNNKKEKKIKCEIRLKRKIGELIDRTDAKEFTYIGTLKRTYDECNQVARPQTPVRYENSAESYYEEYETDSVETQESSGNVLREGQVPDNITIKEDTTTGLELLKKTLHDICYLHKEAKNCSIEKKLEYSETVRRHFKYYEQVSEHHNSVLHDILQGYEQQQLEQYEMKLYKLINDFDLKDLVCDSRNIYNNTALMYACIFNKPQLIRALINMECPIQAQDSDDGNNVLHIISQHQTAEDCRKCVIDTVKATKKRTVVDSFIRALKDYNLSGLVPLHVAVMSDNVKLVAEFLRFCKKHDALDVVACRKQSDGNTILHQAVINKSSRMVSCILKYIPRSYLNLQNFNGNTAAEEIDQEIEEPSFSDLVDAFATIELT